MLIVLQSISGESSGRRMQLRSGQVLTVGASGWVDFSVTDDAALAEQHFEVRSTAGGCVVRTLAADAGLSVNGEATDNAVAYDGDELIAGKTRFRLTITGGPGRPEPALNAAVAEPEAGGAAVAIAAPAAALGLAGVCGYLELGDQITEQADAVASPDELIESLTSEKKFHEALRLRGFLLERRQAIWWGCCCLREDIDEPLPPSQVAALEASETWVRDPTDANRRAAEAKAADAKYSGPGALLALGTFWADGSLAPEGATEVEADDRLASQGVASSLLSAAYWGDPTQATERFLAFLDRGRRLDEGELATPAV